MLMTFTGDRAHPHLVSLLATYEQFNQVNMVFPWSEAHLKRYLQKVNPSPILDHETVM